MADQSINTRQGHWILARMGKRVLRPGGKLLTEKMIDRLEISSNDHVVEFAPGMGFTSKLVLHCHPGKYTGLELNNEAAERLNKQHKSDRYEIIVGDAASSPFDGETIDKVYGEAMLTMQSKSSKTRLIKEAFRILKKNGIYALHELCIISDDISNERKIEIQKELADVFKIYTRIPSLNDWKELMEANGFEIKSIDTSPVLFLENKAMIQDEGILQTLLFYFNLFTHSTEKKRIIEMRDTFRKHAEHLNAFVMIVEKK